ncbi:MAG: PilZ domain-containing protein [Candidatus Omnitrophica bacterium]|nr:PilZ domain-containing protein [Candidatus Omnitrophota bacterium]
MENPSGTPIVEFRHFIRHPLRLPLAYKIIKPGAGENKNEVRSETINISMGGLLFPSRHPVKTGTPILIRMPFEGKIFNIRAKVVRSVNNSQTKLYDIAVSFPKSKDAFKVKMIEQIYLIAEYRDLRRVKEGVDISLEEASREWIKRYAERFSKIHW